MKKLHLLTLAAATVLTLGGLAGCGSKDTGKEPDTSDKEDETIVKKDLTIEVTNTKDKFQVGQKARLKFTADGKELTNDERGGLEAKISNPKLAIANPGEQYIAFSAPGKVKVTFSSKYFNEASVEFTIIDRIEVAGMMNLVISGPAQQADFIQEVADEYNATKPEGEKINFILEDHGEDKVDSEILDWKKGPDVFAFASDKIAELTKKNVLSKLPDAQKAAVKTEMTAGAQEAAAFPLKENYVAYPYAGDNGYYLFYNKSLVTSEQVKSMDTLFDAAKAKNLKVAYPLNTAFYSAGALFTYGSRYTMSYDGNGNLAGVTANFDEANGIKAGKAILHIMTNDAYEEKQAAPTKDNGLVACVDGSWNAAAYKKTLGNDFACTKLPTVSVDGDVKNLSSFLGYKLYGVNKTKTGERQTAAHEFAEYLTSAAIQELRFDRLSIAPTNKEVAALEKVQNDPAIKAISEQAEFAVAQTAVPANVWSAPTVFTQSIIEGRVTESNIGEYMKTLNDSIKASR